MNKRRQHKTFIENLCHDIDWYNTTTGTTPKLQPKNKDESKEKYLKLGFLKNKNAVFNRDYGLTLPQNYIALFNDS